MKNNTRKSELVTADTAAQELTTTQMKVLMLIKRQNLQGEMIDGEWYVQRQSLDYFKTHGPEETEQQAACASSCSKYACGCHS